MTTLHAAAAATAAAHGFVATLPGAEITYQAPDRVQQVEHGTSVSASGSNGGSVSSSGPRPSTITKVFIGDQYYEATDAGGEPEFSSWTRCPNDQSGADFTLNLLRAIALADDISVTDGVYTFHLGAAAGSLLPPSGTATIENGYVRTLSLLPTTQTLTITAIDSAPPVTAPASSSPSNVTCG